MNFTHGKVYKVALLAMVIALLFSVSHVQWRMNRDRARLGLTRMEPLENAPPVLAFTTVALGGFRGLIANALWIRATDLQENDKFFEMVQLADWITKLEPHFGQVWFFQAWNMAYNISVKFSDPADRWRWVQRGIALLRDEGLRFNPDETLLYRELSWIYQHKMGNNLDDAHQFYKAAWAEEMQKLFGGKPRFDELTNPQTPEQVERVRILREKYKIDPQIMRETDALYGPLEWRLPDAHAVYWAEVGRRRGKKEDQETLRRSIYQTMQMAFMRGGFTENKIDKTFTLGPNLDLAEKVNSIYEKMMKEDPENPAFNKTGHKNFVLNAMYFLYLANRRAEAVKFYSYLEKNYPEALLGRDKQKLSLDELAIENLTMDVGETDVTKTTAAIEGLFATSFSQRAQGNEDDATSYERMAQQIWNRFQKEIKGSEDRVGLEPLNVIRQKVLDQVLDPETGFSPAMSAQLRTALGLPAPQAPPTNSVPVIPPEKN